MTSNLMTFDLTPFRRNSVGLDHVMDRMFTQLESASSNNYPPYNIVKIDEDNINVEIAVAGFKRDEITITVKNGDLSIEGNKPDSTDADVKYLHRGIGTRRFVRSFVLADYFEVEAAELEDGILRIHLARHVPESMRPKLIEIR